MYKVRMALSTLTMFLMIIDYSPIQCQELGELIMEFKTYHYNHQGAKEFKGHRHLSEVKTGDKVNVTVLIPYAAQAHLTMEQFMLTFYLVGANQNLGVKRIEDYLMLEGIQLYDEYSTYLTPAYPSGGTYYGNQHYSLIMSLDSALFGRQEITTGVKFWRGMKPYRDNGLILTFAFVAVRDIESGDLLIPANPFFRTRSSPLMKTESKVRRITLGLYATLKGVANSRFGARRNRERTSTPF